MTGDIYKSVDDSALILHGGSAWNKGSFLELRGTGGSQNGSFLLAAIRSGDASTCNLTGDGTGALYWDRHDLSGSAILEKSLGGATSYIKYASGLILQFGYIEGSSSVTFPISFSREPKITVTAVTDTPSYAGSVTVSGPSNIGFTINHNGTANPAYYWIAVGI
jgi:hypothetical protein